MYSVIGAARGLTSLELLGFDFPLAVNGHCHLSALGGMRLRHLVLNATRFQDDARRSLAEALMAVLADLPQLVSLEMSFPRCAVNDRHGYPAAQFPGYGALTFSALSCRKLWGLSARQCRASAWLAMMRLAR